MWQTPISIGNGGFMMSRRIRVSRRLAALICGVIGLLVAGTNAHADESAEAGVDFLRTGDFNAAVTVTSKEIERVPRNDPAQTARLLLILASGQQGMGQLAAAAGSLEQAVSLSERVGD